MLSIKTLFDQARSMTKTNYNSYLKLFAWIFLTICLLIIANMVVSQQQTKLTNSLNAYVQQNVSSNLGEVIDETDTVKKMQLDQEIQNATIQFYQQQENIPYFLYIVLFFLIMAVMQNIMKLWITQTARNLSVTPTSYKRMDFLQPSGKVIQLIVADFLRTCFVFLWLLIFIIPGIYIAIRLSFIDYALVVDNKTTWWAIKHSRKVTEGKVRYLFKTYFLFFIMQFVWALLLIVWLFWTMPRMRTIQWMLYRKLNTSSPSHEDVTA